jgi:hypothetical protein
VDLTPIDPGVDLVSGLAGVGEAGEEHLQIDFWGTKALMGVVGAGQCGTAEQEEFDHY